MARPGPLYTTIDLDGPFFTKDPSKTLRANARSMMRGFALEGRADIAAQLRSGEGSRARISTDIVNPRVSLHVAAGVPYTPLAGKMATAGVIRVHVYVPNFGYTARQARALMAAYSRVERQTHAFRRTTSRLRRAKKLNAAELLKGLT